MAQTWRTPIITGNWKMHKTIEQAAQFVESLAAKIEASQAREVKLFLAVPYTVLFSLKEKIQNQKIALVLGAQNMNDATEGAFTGEIAAKMLQEAGAQFVLLGHSERRQIFGESNDFINRKVHRACATGLIPVLCVGETLKERENDETFTVIERQLRGCLQGITKEEAHALILAYEPVWAIGTGKVALPEDAQKVHAFCRKTIASLFGEEYAERLIIQYGGSVQPENAQSLMVQEDIDGLLVGGASLQVEAFYKIIQQCEQTR